MSLCVPDARIPKVVYLLSKGKGDTPRKGRAELIRPYRSQFLRRNQERLVLERSLEDRIVNEYTAEELVLGHLDVGTTVANRKVIRIR